MNSFDINRFGRALRWMISVNFRSLLMWTLGLTLGVAMGELMVRAMIQTTTPQETHTTGILGGFFVVYIIIGVVVGICNLFVELDKKPRRQAFLMLPATNLEKFLAATVFATVSGFVMMHLSFIVGDTLRVAFRAIGVHHTLGYRLMGLVFLVCGLTWVHSFYTLGGTLFRKYAFVISSIALVVGVTLLVWLSKNHEIRLFVTNYENGVIVKEQIGTVTYILTAFFAVFSVVNYWLSFRIFKGFELITNKWMNYDFYK